MTTKESKRLQVELLSRKGYKLKTLKSCLRCGKSWLAKSNNPVQCAICKSAYWNRPRKMYYGEMP